MKDTVKPIDQDSAIKAQEDFLPENVQKRNVKKHKPGHSFTSG